MRLFRPAMLLLLAACGRPEPAVQAIDDVDPAVTAAANDPLMTDPELEGRANRDVLRPADEPLRAMLPPEQPDPLRGDAPPTAMARVTTALATPAFARCDATISYSYGWASRLNEPATLPAKARVAEAAGRDTPGCALRVVAFSADAPPSALIADYRRRAVAAGYAVEERAEGATTTLTARRGPATLIVTTMAGKRGSLVDLLSNAGE